MISETHKEKMERKKRLRAATNGNNTIGQWMLKSYKTETKKGTPTAQQHSYGEPLPAVKRRVKQLNRSYDLSKHEDRKEIGPVYLDYNKKNEIREGHK
jgi:hypothetical protein